MPKSKVQARLLKRGDIVRLPDGVEEVVRQIDVVLQLSNGNNVSISANEMVEVVPPEKVPQRDDDESTP